MPKGKKLKRGKIMNFKDSKLFERLLNEAELTEEAQGFLDACTDDWEVIEHESFSVNGEAEYYIRSDLHGYHNGQDIDITEIHICTFGGAVALIEHLAFMERLKMKANGFGADYE